ncbi:UPF0481 protein At3g47200-like [Corylus avellana]|uniref:UPF0481 protein At3g47200-like n=1 Tax=Corylus avellana TaxID=13451 RepID=UPI00286B1C46|nr:UPF0481 protein At3g47200-like [Corylus avellana]
MSTIEEGESSRFRNQDNLLARHIFSKYNPLSRSEPIAPKHCIFRLPQRFMKINDVPLKPQVVAIGPYCSERYGQLQKMEDVKMQCLYYFLNVTQADLVECLRQIRPHEEEIIGCYSEINNHNTDELLQMMIVDGFFILYVLLYHEKFVHLDDNPLYRLERVILPKIYTDLLLLENQIPFWVLDKLYEICNFNTSISMSLSDLITGAISAMLQIPSSINKPPQKCLHLLHFVRSICISSDHHNEYGERYYVPFSRIPCVTKLRGVGIKVNRHKEDNLLGVKLNGGVIEMPKLTLNNAMCSFLVNCVAFEQCHNCSMHFSIYATFLEGLVNTVQDAEYLSDHRVIENFFGTNAEVVRFIKDLGKDLNIHLAEEEFYLFELFEDVAKYYQKRLHWANWQWTNFKREYFGKPWLLISAFVGILFFILTFLQTYYTIYAYKHPPRSGGIN